MKRIGIEIGYYLDQSIADLSVNRCFEPRLSIACLLRNVPRGPWGKQLPGLHAKPFPARLFTCSCNCYLSL